MLPIPKLFSRERVSLENMPKRRSLPKKGIMGKENPICAWLFG